MSPDSVKKGEGKNLLLREKKASGADPSLHTKFQWSACEYISLGEGGILRAKGVAKT